MTERQKPVHCFGEILLRLSAPGRAPLLQLPSFDAWFGGAEANVAVALARLGTPSAMTSIVPDDALGDAAIDHLRRAGVDIAGVGRGSGRLGLYYLAHGAGARTAEVIYDRAGSLFALQRPGAFDWTALLEGAGWLHLSGITPALGADSAKLALEAARAANRLGVQVSFDGNYRARLWERWSGDPRAVLGELVAEAHLLFGNHRDIALLLDRPFSGEGEERRREAASAAFAAFPRLRLIASTARHVHDADRHSMAARIDTPDDHHQTEEIGIGGIVDRIGSGDAFAAGVLHASAGSLAEMAETGLAMAALKHGTPGDASWASPRDLAAFHPASGDVRR